MKCPYSYTDPVSNPDMFLGYNTELDEIVTGVIKPEDTRLSYFVVGAWRMGKTSVLHQVSRRLNYLEPDPDHFIVTVFIDLLALSNDEMFWGYLARKIGHRLKTIGVLGDNQQICSDFENAQDSLDPDSLCILLERLLSAFRNAKDQNLRIIILLDEFGRVLKSKDNDILSNGLRMLHTDQRIRGVLAYIIAGNYQTLVRTKYDTSPLANILNIITLHTLSHDDTLALIQKPIDHRIPVEASEFIYAQSGGHPYLTQYLMYWLCEMNKLDDCTQKIVLDITRQFAEKHLDFSKWYEKMSMLEREVYNQCATSSGRISADDIIGKMVSISVPGESRKHILEKEEIMGAFPILAMAGLIRKSGDEFYELAGEWFKNWFLKRYQPSGKF